MAEIKKKKPTKSAKLAVSKKKTRKLSKKPWSRVKWVCVGIDSSYYSISIGGIAKTKDGKIRAAAVAKRWTKDDHYFKRLEDAAMVHHLMMELFQIMKVEPQLDEVFIVHEEPAAISHIQKGASGVVKQQIEIGGAMLGGLLRWGWKEIWQIPATKWQAVIAKDLGITAHHSKWNPTKKEGKFRAKEWVEKFHPKWDGHWPDIIRHSKLGMIPRPDTSKARGEQSDDRYEALAIAYFMRMELKKDA